MARHFCLITIWIGRLYERAYIDGDKKKGVSRVRFSRNAFAQKFWQM